MAKVLILESDEHLRERFTLLIQNGRIKEGQVVATAEEAEDVIKAGGVEVFRTNFIRDITDYVIAPRAGILYSKAAIALAISSNVKVEIGTESDPEYVLSSLRERHLDPEKITIVTKSDDEGELTIPGEPLESPTKNERV